MEFYRKVTDNLKIFWTRILLRKIRYKNNYKKMNALYIIKDPWHMSTLSQQYRFTETNRFIKEKLGQLGSILEIGCGEGHQSMHLQRVCDHLTGVDVSKRAVERSRKRCPKGKFLSGDIFSHKVDALAPFDIVVACEVLYYMSDVPAALRRIEALGKKCLVTYFNGEMERLDPMILTLPGVISETLEFNNSRWRIVLWKGNIL